MASVASGVRPRRRGPAPSKARPFPVLGLVPYGPSVRLLGKRLARLRHRPARRPAALLQRPFQTPVSRPGLQTVPQRPAARATSTLGASGGLHKSERRPGLVGPLLLPTAAVRSQGLAALAVLPVANVPAR